MHDDLTFFTNEPGATLLDRFRHTLKEQLPIPSAIIAQKAFIIERVQKILEYPDSPDAPCIEAEINRLVYELYDLTPVEIEIVEGKK